MWAFIVLMLACSPPGEGLADKGPGPVKLSCSKMEVLNKKRQVVCIGDVVLEKSSMRMTCSRLEASYDKDGNIDRAVCKGDVRFLMPPPHDSGDSVSDRREAGGDRAVYISSPEKVIITGSPWIRQGENLLKGERMVYYPAEDRVVVEKAKGSLVVKEQDKRVRP